MLKQIRKYERECPTVQPPSGGCVLKLGCEKGASELSYPAAFRRLCVETQEYQLLRARHINQPPSGGCVLKQVVAEVQVVVEVQPPSGGCVLKQFRNTMNKYFPTQPPSGGCVLKLYVLARSWS